MAPKKALIGIDIGTKYSSIGIWTGNAVNTTTISSCVAFSDSKEPMIVAECLMGETYSDVLLEGDLVNLWPFEVISGNNDEARIVVPSSTQPSPEEIVCMIYKELKELAEHQIGREEVVFDAVISVPSFFSNSQRIATMDAARRAGINVLRLINETTATALAERWSEESCRKKHQEERDSESRTDLMKKEDVLVFDIGGGTLSVAVINIKPGWKDYEVKAVAGHTHLGGNDMDAALAGHCIKHFTDLHPKRSEIMISGRSIETLRSGCELARMLLCFTDNHNLTRTTVNVKSFDGVLPLSVTVTPDNIESLNKGLFKVCKEKIQECLQDSQVSQVQEVILVGGCSDMPRIREILKDLCKVREFREFETPSIAVVHGATILAASLSGAGVHGLQVSDVTPQSIGVMCTGTTLRNFIPRYTKIPSGKYDFETSVDSQGVLKFGVYEGESEVMKNNNLLGYFIFSGIIQDENESGRPVIKVTLSIDHNGILVISAVITRLLQLQMCKREITSEEVLKMAINLENQQQEEEVEDTAVVTENSMEVPPAAEPATFYNTSYEAESDSEAGSNYEAESDSEAGSNYEAESDSEAGSNYEAESDSEAGSNYEAESDSEADSFEEATFAMEMGYGDWKVKKPHHRRNAGSKSTDIRETRKTKTLRKISKTTKFLSDLHRSWNQG